MSSEPRIAPEILQRASKVRLLVLDVDGTLTDGRIWIGPTGEALKSFHVRDGLGLRLVQKAGVALAWVTARTSPIVAHRAQELGIERVVQGCADKLEALRKLCTELGITPSEVAWMGDDLPDRPALRAVGLAAAPADAHPWVAASVHWQSTLPGGAGAVRELCDLLLVARSSRDRILEDWGG